MTPEKNDLGIMTAVPHDITLKDRTFTLSPLNMQDFARFEQWSRQQKIATIRQAIKDEEPEVRALVLSKVKFDADDTDSMSYSGMLYLLWLAAIKVHKDLELEELAELFVPAEVMQMNKLVDELSGYEETEDPPAPKDGSK